MALFDVSDFKRYSDLRRQILPSGQTHLGDRTTHYSFGLKKQELAVPLGVDVSILIFHVNIYRGSQPPGQICALDATRTARLRLSLERTRCLVPVCTFLNWQDKMTENIRLC